MSWMLALVAGYLIGARTGGKELDQLAESLKALCDTDEFADVVSSARAQVGGTLRAVAAMVEGDGGLTETGGDLVAQVKNLVSRG